METYLSEALTTCPVIIDCGSGSTKVGLSGEENVKHVFPTFIGRAKY